LKVKAGGKRKAVNILKTFPHSGRHFDVQGRMLCQNKRLAFDPVRFQAPFCFSKAAL